MRIWSRWSASRHALEEDPDAGLALEALPELIDQLETKMKEAAKKLDFEEAANLAIGSNSCVRRWRAPRAPPAASAAEGSDCGGSCVARSPGWPAPLGRIASIGSRIDSARAAAIASQVTTADELRQGTLVGLRGLPVFAQQLTGQRCEASDSCGPRCGCS